MKVFLFAVAAGLLLATSTMFAGATCHIFGMARDNQLPFSSVWTRTNKDGSPWAASILVAVLGLVPVFIFTTNTASIVGGATAAMYVSYFLVTVVVLWSLFRGWPKKRAYFNLGRWNLVVVTVIAMFGAGFMAVSLLWPRASTNPNLDEINGTVSDSVLRHIPMGSYLVGVPVLLGVVYFFAWQRRIDAQADAEPEAAMVSKGELIADHHECLGARSEIAPTVSTVVISAVFIPV